MEADLNLFISIYGFQILFQTSDPSYLNLIFQRYNTSLPTSRPTKPEW